MDMMYGQQRLCTISVLIKFVLVVSCLTVAINIFASFSLSFVDKLPQFNQPFYEGHQHQKENVRRTEYFEKNQISKGKQNQKYGQITVYPFKGELGNQMFQLASLLGISRQNNLSMFLHSENFRPDGVFELPKWIKREDVNKFEWYNNVTEKAHARYVVIPLDATKNWTLEGYFQSYKYFNGCKDDVNLVFKFKSGHINVAKRFLQQKAQANNLTIGIHVRRRDFISSEQRKLGRVAPGVDYITKAMQIFQRQYKNVTFIVISDQMTWCSKNIKGNNIFLSPFHDPGIDLALASLCDHMIITVGTYGWWAGWLSGGQVIYYADYPIPGSKIDREFSKEDYYPADWIPLSA